MAFGWSRTFRHVSPTFRLDNAQPRQYIPRESPQIPIITFTTSSTHHRPLPLSCMVQTKFLNWGILLVISWIRSRGTECWIIEDNSHANACFFWKVKRPRFRRIIHRLRYRIIVSQAGALWHLVHSSVFPYFRILLSTQSKSHSWVLLCSAHHCCCCCCSFILAGMQQDWTHFQNYIERFELQKSALTER